MQKKDALKKIVTNYFDDLVFSWQEDMLEIIEDYICQDKVIDFYLFQIKF